LLNIREEPSCEMSDRRRTSRFVIPDFTNATFRMMQDVCIERSSAEQVILVSDVPLRTGEELLLELPRELDARTVRRGDVANCTTVWIGAARRYRVVLRTATVTDTGRDARPSSLPGATPRPALPALGVLIRRVPVRIHDVSSTGCLLESADVLAEGAVGQLEIHFNDITHQEPLRICRSSTVSGTAWPWRSGAHFLSLTPPLASSVRNIVARFEIVDELARTGRSLIGSAPKYLPGHTTDYAASSAAPPEPPA
jgi:hypothetical protein